MKNLAPNGEVPKNPAVSNVGTNDVYVFVKISVPVKNVTMVGDDGTKDGSGKKNQEIFYFKQNTDSNFLLFAIKKATEPGSSWKVRNPQGIPYLAKDEKLKKLWLDKERASKPKIRFEVLENTVAPSGYVPEKEKRIGDLFD